MEKKFTPGPWFTYFDAMPHPFSKGQWRVKADDDIQFPIALLPESIGGRKDDNGNNPTIKANALLCAAAPELLEALIKVMQDVDNNQMWDYVDQMGIINVINKALGTPINLTDPITQSKIEREANNG